MKQKLAGSKYGDDDYITGMVAAFENRTKRLFDGEMTNYAVEFGTTRDNDRPRGIIKGRLSLTMNEVSSTFEDVIHRIVNSCLVLLCARNVKYVLLVGGFGESIYLQKELTKYLKPFDVIVVTVEEQTKKAAAEGAAVWYVKQSVAARIARTTLGTSVMVRYNPESKEHRKRESLMFIDDDGLRVRGGFNLMIRKGTRLGSNFTVEEHLYRTFPMSQRVPQDLTVNVLAYDGDDAPRWMVDYNGKQLPQFRRLCSLTADISNLHGSLKLQTGLRGPYYETHYIVFIRLGGTKLQARLQWKEDGALREGPITIIPGNLT